MIGLGTAHRDYGKPLWRPPAPQKPPQPKREAFSEERTCARDGCENTFTVRGDNRHKAYCSNSCARRAPYADREPSQRARAGYVAVQPTVCAQCGASFQPAPRRPRHCSWRCVLRAAAGPAEHGATCPCLACGERRRELGQPPLIGDRP